jgi:hypothetical protein
MKKAVFTTAALAIGAGLVGGSAVAASAVTKAPAHENTGPLGLMSQTDVAPALVPAADTVMRVAKQGNLTKGSAFDAQSSTVTGKNKAAKVSGVYLDGMGRAGNKKPAIPVKNPLGSGSVQVHPLNGPTSAGVGSLLNQG